MQRGRTPYKQFGRRLSEIRQRLKETVPEVSGAVEVETETLLKYESGEERPSEDVLMLLLNHFNIRDDEADELWSLAGYDNTESARDELPNMQTLVMIPFDSRIVYTDTAHVSINNFGVVLNFMQNGVNNQPTAVARVGMSLDHAKSVLEVLAKTIAQAEAAKQPKQIPNSTKQSRTRKS